jgi:hypothetical protein
MSSNSFFGGATDLYKNRYQTQFDQLKYEEDDYVCYPDVLDRNWLYYSPVGGSIFGSIPTASTSGITGAVTRLQFNIPSGSTADPSSFRVLFNVYVGDNTGAGSSGTTSLSNSASSVFTQLIVRLQGNSGGIIEQNIYYNIFCNMLYQFYSTNYLTKIAGTLEGYNTTNANRAWNGRQMVLPLNAGFFQNLRKYIPLFALPNMQIEFLMEQAANATCQKTVGTAQGTASYYYIANPRLMFSSVDVTSNFIQDMREKISMAQTEQIPIRLDYTAWTPLQQQIPSGTSGNYTAILSGNLIGLRKVLFGFTSPSLAGTGTTGANGTTANGGADYLNTFSNNGLQNYRLRINGKYYPETPVEVNQGGTTSTTALSVQGSMSYFMNVYATGQHNAYYTDINAGWLSSDTFTSGIDQSPNYVYMLSTQYDDVGLPQMLNMVNAGPFNIDLNFISALSNSINLVAFANVHRGIHLFEGNRVTIIEN